MEGSTENVDKLPDVGHHPSTWRFKAVAAQNNCRLSGADHHRSKSRYTGVVAQNSGRWGAVIYTRRNKLWLGTFDREDEAAIAYDRANLKLQQGPVNFLTHDYSKEIRFQDMYSKQEILDMIKDHSYEANFRRFMTSLDQLKAHTSPHKNNKGEGGVIERKREVLFRKQLTPSDIGKLNQLVLPKYHAERYFSLNFPLDEVHGR